MKHHISRINKGLWIVFLALIAGPVSATPCTQITITNNVSLKECSSKYCGDKPTLQYFSAANTGSGGEVISNNASKTFTIPTDAAMPYVFGLQINAARIGSKPPTGKTQCDQLCGHISLNTSTGDISQGSGTCGANQYSPTWSVGSATGSKSDDTCTITIVNPTINNNGLCACPGGGYPCAVGDVNDIGKIESDGG